MVRRVYIGKKDGFDVKARQLKLDITSLFGSRFTELKELKSLKILRRYDVDLLEEEQFEQAVYSVLSDPRSDLVYFSKEPPLKETESFFGIESLPGQYVQRADSAEQCVELAVGIKPKIRTADIYIFEGANKPLTETALNAIKSFIINPVDSKETSINIPNSLLDAETEPNDVPVLTGFIQMKNEEAEILAKQHGLAMFKEDLFFCRDWFLKEGRDPTLAELKVLDTYWSDHCRHTTFNTELETIDFAAGGGSSELPENEPLKKALELYEKTRQEVYGSDVVKRKRSLMDMATLGAKALKKKGLLSDLDESPEVNACTIKIKAEFKDAKPEDWLLLFKNETHNHPTEIEPYGGASTCLGGGIRDPLSGRAYVHQAMRITGGGDPRAAMESTLPGKLPQIKIAHEAAEGYSSYANQIGLASGYLAEIYHPGFIAKRMELGALIGAVPEVWVRREEPAPGDVVILVGGKTGRDGIGGATSSSKIQSGESMESAGAEVQKGNPVEERKIVRLFRKPEISRLIKRCNDFGAGGVSVAVGELADGLDINLDAVPVKYPGLNGTELAISESQERMAVVTSAADAELFIKAADEENCEAVIIARVTAKDNARLRMNWRGKTIVDLSREFLNTGGASRKTKALLPAPGKETPGFHIEENEQNKTKFENSIEMPLLPASVLLDNLERELAGLRSGSRRGLAERFGSSAGAASVLFPWGGSEQGTPECGMAALLPSLDRKSLTASIMSFGYDPIVMSEDPYSGAKGSVREALAKFACLGGDPFKARLSFQEYFEKTVDAETWGRPAAALLGALEAQLRLEVPAIGGKDSMSGNYSDGEIKLTVPPVLAAFAAGIAPAANIRSGALSGKSENIIILLSQSFRLISHNDEKAAEDEWELFAENMKTLEALSASGALKAAYPVMAGGVAVTLAVMAFGNMTGVEAYADSFSYFDPMNYQGSILAEINVSTLPPDFNYPLIVAAKTLDEPIYRIVLPSSASSLAEDENPESLAAEIPLDVLRRAYEYPLAEVYPQTSTGATVAEPSCEKPLVLPAIKPDFSVMRNHVCLHKHAVPLVVIPVFPGTNCEWDTEKAFREAGAKTRFVIFRNRRREDITESLKEMADAFKEAQIIAFSGGSSAGCEPDGSAKFIDIVLRSKEVSGAITEFLEKQDGLILSICDGFQALIKSGLLPYGRIMQPEENMPIFTINNIGRHVSRIVRTKVMPNNSPWLSLEKEGSIHFIPVDHGEGRLVISSREAEALFAAGQVPFCYADADGNPTMAEPDNPNGSAFAIEALTSPDGRILGKMAHSERRGELVHINIPGNKSQRIFEAGINYFK